MWKAELLEKPTKSPENQQNLRALVRFSNDDGSETFDQVIPGNDLTPDNLGAFCQRIVEMYETRDAALTQIKDMPLGPITLPRDKMSFAYVNSAANAAVSNVVTGAIDTTGATLIVIFVGRVGSAAPTDSKSNTWTPRTAYGEEPLGQLYYCVNPTVGSGHTFTCAGSNNYAVIAAVAVSGVAASPYDVENGATGVGSTLSTGSVTPSENNEIVITGYGMGGGGTPSINGGFTLPASIVSGSAYSGGIAYLIQTTATAANPQWATTAGDAQVAAIATFKAAAVAGGGVRSRLTMMGVG